MTIAQLYSRQHEMTTAEYEKRFREEIAPQYRRAFSDIDNRLKSVHATILSGVAKEDYYNEMIKYGRYRSLMAATEQAFNESARRAGVAIRASSEAVFSNSFYMRQYSYDIIIPDGLKSISILPQPLIDLAVMGTPEVWVEIDAKDRARIERLYGSVENYQPKYGTLQSVLLAERTRELNAIKNAITQGFIQGRSYTNISKDVRSIFNTTASNAMRIVRTEGNRLANAGNFAASATSKAQGVDIVRQWDATLDTRTREAHSRLDGQREDKDGYFKVEGQRAKYPSGFGVGRLDINCRCAVVDVVAGQGPMVRTARDPITGENMSIGFAKFDDWAKVNDLSYRGGKLVYNPASL